MDTPIQINGDIGTAKAFQRRWARFWIRVVAVAFLAGVAIGLIAGKLVFVVLARPSGV